MKSTENLSIDVGSINLQRLTKVEKKIFIKDVHILVRKKFHLMGSQI